MADDGSVSVSVVVLTKNEEAGIASTIEHLRAFDEVVVVDSDSSDRTASIAADLGARVVNFRWNGMYPKKKQWALQNAGLRNDWVLLLDADEFPSEQLVEEIAAAIASNTNAFGAFDIQLLYKFAGRFLKHGHTVTKRSLLSRRAVYFPEMDDLSAPGIGEVEGHYQPVSTLPVGKLRGRLYHDDVDPVSSWFERHNRYSDWEAFLRMDSEARRQVASKRTRRGRLFDLVPGKPLAFFLYSYVARAGFLDGRAGFDYALALSSYYWQIGLKERELQRRA